MVDYRSINNNILANRWKEKYEQCSQDVKDKLDKLDDKLIKEYQLQVIKRKKVYPEIGDIFQIRPCENIELYGIVVNNHVNNKNGDDLIVIFIFKEGVDIDKSVKNGIKKEELLIAPEIVGKEYWSRGFFFNVGHTEIHIDNYGFYDIVDRVFYDEYENELKNEPYLLGTYGVATISGIAYVINQEMIISGMI